ncbi:MAG: DUF1178 family protein [Acuticoccus sp.]
MIRYALRCCNGHDFDGWFASSEAFETQLETGDLACPLCGAEEVARALMAPAVRTGAPAPATSEETPGTSEPAAPASVAPPAPPDALRSAEHKALIEAVRLFREKVVEHGTDVGTSFPEEARRIHYGEAEPRGIYGQAEMDEARALVEEGIDIIALPVLPEDRN